MCVRNDGLTADEVSNFKWAGRSITQNKQSTENTYQLGWHSVMWFRKENNRFVPISGRDLPNASDAKDIQFAPDKSYSQIVTRGVASCSAAIISRDDLYCFMHLDSSTIDRYGDSLSDEIRSKFSKKTGQISVCASILDGQTEQGFIQSLDSSCRDAYYFGSLTEQIDFRKLTYEVNGTEVNMQVLNRGEAGAMAHKEFGISCSSRTPNPVVFGDITTMESSKLTEKSFRSKQSDFQSVTQPSRERQPLQTQHSKQKGGCVLL